MKKNITENQVNILTISVIIGVIISGLALSNAVYYYFSVFHSDAGSYLRYARDFGMGELPPGVHRPPLYPFLLSLFTESSRPWESGILTFHLLAVLVALIFPIWFVLRRHVDFIDPSTETFPLKTALLVVTAIGCGAFLLAAASHISLYVTVVGPEMLYLSLLTVGTVLIAMGGTSSACFVALGSTLLGLSVWAKPSSIVLIIALFLAANWLRVHRGKKWGFASVLPFLLTTLLLVAYNGYTTGWFTYSGFGSVNMVRGTVMFMENDPSYPPLLQKGIEDFKSESGVHEAGHELRTGWNLYEIARSERPHSNFPAVEKHYLIEWLKENEIGGGVERLEYTKDIYKEMAYKNIANNPMLYIKMVAARIYYYFIDPEFVIHDYIKSGEITPRGLDRHTYAKTVERWVNTRPRLISPAELEQNPGAYDREREHVLQALDNSVVTLQQKEDGYKATLSSPLWDTPSSFLGGLFLGLMPLAHWLMLGGGAVALVTFLIMPGSVGVLWFAPLLVGLMGSGLRGATVLVANWNSRYLAGDILIPALAAILILQAVMIMIVRRHAFSNRRKK